MKLCLLIYFTFTTLVNDIKYGLMLQKHEQTFIAFNPMAISIDILPMPKIVFGAFANGRGIGTLRTQRPGIGPETNHRSFLCLISILRTKRFPVTIGWNREALSNSLCSWQSLSNSLRPKKQNKSTMQSNGRSLLKFKFKEI